MCILDDATRWQWQFLLREKSDAAEEFRNWQAEVELQTGRKVKIVRTDNGREFVASLHMSIIRQEQ